ncbi:MAG: peptide chain release factor N(5)-glutamine methyltransferase, partial [Planctomycetes bacterium]|nr:peptide chain release factor N(5)-glutamine methyltransferase [Planctomycetota bacterium]
DSPRLDAEVLLAESLECQRIELYTTFDNVPAEKARGAFRELVRRRAAGMPVAYLVGHREFFSLSFRVTPDVLIPRPETEFLVTALLDLARKRPADREIAICDVGTGSGNIAVSVAKHLANARVTAVDSSPAALEVAGTNAAAHGVESRIELARSDLFSAVPAERRFDFVVSNPPYVREAEIESLPRDVRDYEPRDALVAGPRGTEVIESLVPQAAERLNAGGHLLLEINPALHDEVQALVQADGRFEPAPTVKDLARLPRVVRAMRK